MRILRHILIFAILIAAAAVLRRSIPPQPQSTNASSPQVQGESSSKGEYIDLDYQSQIVRVRWFKVEDASKLHLVPNYEEFVTSTDLVEDTECKYVTSGGFYDKQNEPLGLVISEGKQIYEYKKNVLMNGVLSVNEVDTPRISRGMPSGFLEEAVQSGPLLWENGNQLALNLNSDKNARRVIAAINGDNELYFFVFYNPNSSFGGPLLGDLPALVNEINNKLDLNIADAINLDGGSASVFNNADVTLSELSPVGSYWCVI